MHELNTPDNPGLWAVRPPRLPRCPTFTRGEHGMIHRMAGNERRTLHYGRDRAVIVSNSA